MLNPLNLLNSRLFKAKNHQHKGQDTCWCNTDSKLMWKNKTKETSYVLACYENICNGIWLLDKHVHEIQGSELGAD